MSLTDSLVRGMQTHGKGIHTDAQALTLLDSEYRWFTLAEIEEQIGVSDKTIRKIIDEAKQELPPSIHFEISRGKGVILHYDKRNVAIGEVISSMYRQRTFYQSLDVLFAEGRYSLEELADKLYMSSSSLKKLIIRLNNHELKRYHLRIAYSMPEVKGSEISIRYFTGKCFTMPLNSPAGHLPTSTKPRSMSTLRQLSRRMTSCISLMLSATLSFLAAIMITRVAGQICGCSERTI